MTKFVLRGSNWPQNTILYYNLTWKPPSNSDEFILRGYELQFGNKTERIEQSKTETTISVVNGSLDAVTLTAISTCGERGSTTANITQSDFAVSYSTLLAGANNNNLGTNFQENYTITVSLLGVFLSLTLLLSTILSLILTLCVCRSKIESVYNKIRS